MFIKRPELFHGKSGKRPFFEGWYHKMSSKDERSIVVIPGIYQSGECSNKTAFLMLYQGSNGQVDYIPYDTKDFNCNQRSYELRLGENFFSLDNVILNFQNDRLDVKGQITTKGLNPWPVSLFEHGCMGWYGYVPSMECFHGILSMDHKIDGHITVNDDHIDFNDGRGYIEKDWGKNFPKDWIWAQSNHFKEDDISVSASLATIPWRNYEFSGFIIGILYKGELYKFTTYNFSKHVKISFDNDKLHWVIKKRKLTLELEIRKGSLSGLLYAPDRKDMIPKVNEYLDGNISFQLKDSNRILIDQSSNHAAVEIVGKTERLIQNAI